MYIYKATVQNKPIEGETQLQANNLAAVMFPAKTSKMAINQALAFLKTETLIHGYTFEPEILEFKRVRI